MNLRSLTPDAVFRSVLDITPTWLAQQGIKGLAVDLDNTLVPYGQPVPDMDIVHHVQDLVASGFKMVIVSNAGPHRAASAAAILHLPYIANAGKPGQGAFVQAASQLNCSLQDIAVVGDQVFRDVLGARRAGCYAVLVVPMSPRDFPGTKLLRWPEAIFIRHMSRRGQWPEPKKP